MPPPRNSLTIPSAIIIAGALIAGAIIFRSGPNGATAAVGSRSSGTIAEQPVVPNADISNMQAANRPFIGKPDVPVTVYYWLDYQCPFCRKFELESMPQLIKEYILTGKAKIVFKDFQFLGQDSETAGLAGHAIWEVAPDKFYQWHKAMYDNQGTENSGWANRTNILTLAKSLGIDSAEVGKLMADKAAEYKKMMDDDKAEGGSIGVTGTPSFVIGGRLLTGAQPYSVIKQLIDLAEKSKS